MPRRFFRKWVPDERAMRRQRVMRVFGSTLLNRRLWHLNRHSTAWGVAAGLFWAWPLMPLQTVAAVATAIAGRGNVALAMAFTWVSNPLTMIPCFLISYWVGLKVTRAEPIHGLREQLDAVMDAGLIEGTVQFFRLLAEDLPQLYPVYVGNVVMGLASALVGYAIVKLAWRWSVARRWHQRHHLRRMANPTLRLTRGLAHLHRLRREAGGVS